MIYSVQQIKYETIAHIKEFGGDFSHWYVGIANDPVTALHDRHQVDKVLDIWLYKRALTLHACQTVHRYFSQQLKTDGEAPAMLDNDGPAFVYVYKKSERTAP